MEKFKKVFKEKNKPITLSLIGVLLIITSILIACNSNNFKSSFSNVISNLPEEKEFVYLSDIPYIKEQSSVGWGNITLDANLEARYNNGLIALTVNGENKLFLKGVSAHATSTLVYDITDLNYDYFTTYYGVDASRGANGNGVKFSIYTSVDGIEWTLHTPVSPPVKKGNSEAENITIDIKGQNFIKLYANNNGNESSDHAVYAGAKLYKEGYNNEEENAPYDFIKTLEEYDNILTNASYDEVLASKEHTLLQRKFVSNIGYEILQAFAHLDKDHKDVVEWILKDLDALRYYITGGKPTGSYMNSLNVLLKLYTAHKEDLSNTTKTAYHNVLGDLYKRMMITLSLTHSSNVCLWVGGGQCSDAVKRYEIYKEMHAGQNEFNGGEILYNELFESLNIEEMRWVMNNNIDDEEIPWLNYYMRVRGEGNPRRGPYSYIRYTFGYNYNLAKYYSAEEYEKWNNKYNLSKFNITYKTGKPKLWIVFEEGSVCGGISKTGSNLDGAVGIPSAVLGQPGHAAFIEYSKTAEGKGRWSLNNNISGWAYSEKSERLLCGWGSNSWDSYYQVSYIPYAQEALNNLESYNKALETMLLADSYPEDLEKLEEIYNKALEYQSFNMDAWYGLIRTYQRNTAKTALDYINLSKRLTNEMYHFPLPMFDLMKLIQPNLQETEYLALHDNYLRLALQKGAALTSTNTFVLQYDVSKVMANHLLGNNDYSIASFSFDGENANKIMLGTKYEGYGVRWDYSLDGGHNWTATSEQYVLLNATELKSITAENDIKIHIVGSDYSPENIYTIDITENSISENGFYRNDLENRIMGVDTTYEWRRSESEAWTSYVTSSPNNTGNKTLQIRQAASGTKLASNVLSFEFTEDNQPLTRKYVSVSHLAIHSFSTESVDTARPYYALNAIDGNANTLWHTDFRENVLTTGNTPFITIKLDKPRYISAIELKQLKYRSNDPIYAKNIRILVSEDGEDWKETGKIENCPQNEELRVIDFSESIYAEYIKIEMDTYGIFASLSLVNVFQDMTKNPRPTAGIAYSPAEATNGNVIARLDNISTEHYEILSPGGNTHVFTENGEFTFRFRDTNTNVEGSAKAKVTWIDRTAPTATIEYSTNNPTNKEVIATLKPSEDVTVTNNINYRLNENDEVVDNEGNVLEGFTIVDDYVIDANGNKIASANPLTYEFTENGSFTFEFVDKAGNRGSATAKVDWIDVIPPIATLTYDNSVLTNKDVTVNISFNEEGSVTNNSNSKTYTFTENGSFTFEYRDLAGNIGAITARVNWIDKIAPTAELKYENINNKVVVTVINPSEEIIYAEGIGIYEFTKNGSYEIVFYDKAGNVGKLIALINSFEDKPNEPNIPDNPEEPNNPENPGENKNPGTTEPGNPDNSGNNKPNGGDKPTTPNEPNKPNESKPINTEYKKFSIKRVVVRIPSNSLKEEGTLKIEEFELSEELKGKFGDASEYYDIYYTNNSSNRVNVSSESPIKVSIRLNGLKEFIGVYEITDNNAVKLVDYVKNGSDIEITTKSLGKYVVSYNELKPTSPEETIPIKIKKNNKNKNLVWIIASIGVILLGFAIYLFKNPKEIKDN